MEVTDEQFLKVQEDPQYHKDPEFVKECSDAKGNNAVVNLLISRKPSTRDILKGLKMLRSKYKNVAFWDRKHKRFYGGSYE